jgi:beta-xylosidase
MKPHTGIDTFEAAMPAPEWEWNHNPDNTKWSAGGQLTLQTATMTNDLYRARNTLARRILGPSSTATIVLDYSGMRDGDRAGLALFRDRSAWVGIKRAGGSARVAMVNNINMDTSWNTTSTGNEVACACVSGGRVWLHLSVDIRPGVNRQTLLLQHRRKPVHVAWQPFTMTNDWQFFMGYRFAIFNFATQALGGSVTVDSFSLTTP